jgi:hypothetical protein
MKLYNSIYFNYLYKYKYYFSIHITYVLYAFCLKYNGTAMCVNVCMRISWKNITIILYFINMNLFEKIL